MVTYFFSLSMCLAQKHGKWVVTPSLTLTASHTQKGVIDRKLVNIIEMLIRLGLQTCVFATLINVMP